MVTSTPSSLTFQGLSKPEYAEFMQSISEASDGRYLSELSALVALKQSSADAEEKRSLLRAFVPRHDMDDVDQSIIGQELEAIAEV